MTKVFIVIDIVNGNIDAASVKNPIKCMELIDKSERLSEVYDEGKFQPEDLINFTEFLEEHFVVEGISNVVKIEE
jgi:hypothetical protein